MKSYVHNPTEVEAIRVQRPYINVTRAFAFAREHKKANGAFSHFVMQVPGQDALRAWEGDWVIKYPNGGTAVMSDGEFQNFYGDQDDDTEG